MKIDDGIDKLNAAYKRLEEPQGRIARRNARKAFIYALKCLRQGLEDEYPLERKKVTRRRKADPERAVKGKVIIGIAAHRALLKAGVSPSQFVERGKKKGRRTGPVVIYAPEWMDRAFTAGIDHKLIKEAVRSQPKRRRINAMIRLGRKKP